LPSIRDWIVRRIEKFLSEPIDYDRRVANDLELLKLHIRKGDVLLVDGDQRVSALIKYVTQSSWSHAAIYVGDELVRRGGGLRELAVEHFGDEAEHLVVEALMEGVVASPLAKYVDHNIRVCRPHRLRSQHLQVILDEALAAIGWRYDMRNVWDLFLHLVKVTVLSPRRRWRELRFGSDAAASVICTSLIGQLFHGVGFPVLPHVTPLGDPDHESPPQRSRWSAWRRRFEPGAALYRKRHPTHLMPRDFDLSPYFEIVKFNVIKQRGFDYERIAWAEDPTAEDGVRELTGERRADS
jgi:hypothetical protein